MCIDYTVLGRNPVGMKFPEKQLVLNNSYRSVIWKTLSLIIHQIFFKGPKFEISWRVLNLGLNHKVLTMIEDVDWKEQDVEQISSQTVLIAFLTRKRAIVEKRTVPRLNKKSDKLEEIDIEEKWNYVIINRWSAERALKQQKVGA